MSQLEEPVRSLLDAGQLAAIARRLGREITHDYPDGVVLVALLKGSVCFLADLVRELPGPCEIDFLALSSYGDGRTRVRVVKDLDLEVTGRDVIVVLDIVDTGLTLSYVLRLIALRGARSTAALCPSRPTEPQALARGDSLRGPSRKRRARGRLRP